MGKGILTSLTSQYFCFWVDAMSDRLTQVQDAVDQLAQQFVAALHFIRSRHEVEALGPTDKIQEVKTENSMEQSSKPIDIVLQSHS